MLEDILARKPANTIIQSRSNPQTRSFRRVISITRVTNVVENSRVATHNPTNDTTTATTTLHASYIQRLGFMKVRFACLGFPHIVTVKNANPFDWREIIRELHQGKRQILVVQYLFKYLFKGEKNEIKKEGASDWSLVSMACVVEYQKRGLPHLHIFVWCK